MNFNNLVNVRLRPLGSPVLTKLSNSKSISSPEVAPRSFSRNSGESENEGKSWLPLGVAATGNMPLFKVKKMAGGKI
jgi:hypothetical protein